jgi:uncharacterized protein (TIGR02145 family)
MKLLQLSSSLAAVCLSALSLSAQVCDPSTAPTGLVSTYTPGSGALLEWDAVPGSQGVLILAVNPAGLNESKRIQSFELGQFLIPESRLSPGTYTWQIQATCSTLRPFDLTPISASSTFTVGSASTCPATVTDIDGNVYSTVEIGSQCWTAENLKVERYRDGSNIPTGLSNSAWQTTTSGAYAVYNDVAANKATYGLLYNWFAAVDPRGLCPTGWHVPTDGEWTELTDHLGGTGVAGGKMKTTGTLGAGTGLWNAPNTGATNTSGFSGLPGGLRSGINGSFNFQGDDGSWWSSSEYSTESAWNRRLYYDTGNAYRFVNYKQYGFSVRCLRD